MKMVVCNRCGDGFAVMENQPRWCACSRTSAVHHDSITVGIAGPGSLMCLDDDLIASLVEAGGTTQDIDVKLTTKRKSRLPKYPSYLADND